MLVSYAINLAFIDLMVLFVASTAPSIVISQWLLFSFMFILLDQLEKYLDRLHFDQLIRG